MNRMSNLGWVLQYLGIPPNVGLGTHRNDHVSGLHNTNKEHQGNDHITQASLAQQMNDHTTQATTAEQALHNK